MVEKHQLVPTVKVNPMDVSPKIRQFCGNFPIFKVKRRLSKNRKKEHRNTFLVMISYIHF